MSIRRAESELLVLSNEIQALEKRISDSRNRMSDLETYIKLSREFGSNSEFSEDIPSRRSTIPKLEIYTNATKEIFREYGSPMLTAALHQHLLARGLDVGGSNPITNLSSILSRSGVFVNDRKLGWSLQEADSRILPDEILSNEKQSDDYQDRESDDLSDEQQVEERSDDQSSIEGEDNYQLAAAAS